jgi:hypothetical protein
MISTTHTEATSCVFLDNGLFFCCRQRCLRSPGDTRGHPGRRIGQQQTRVICSLVIDREAE